YNGVVYNEMAGAYSSPEEFSWKILCEQLFPDTIYKNDSGGDPDCIPELTWEAFKEFHASFYHQSNAQWLLYGSIPLETHCAFIDERLQGFSYLEPKSAIPLQPRFSAPKTIEYRYPAASKKDEHKCIYTIAWMFDSIANQELVVALSLLADILIGNSGCPVRKALIDSGLGEDLTDTSGFSVYYQQPLFAVGLRGAKPGKLKQFLEVVNKTIQALIHDGIDEKLLEASLHQFEYSSREISNNFPIKILDKLACFTTYELDPVLALSMSETITKLRITIKNDPAYLSRLLQTWFIENTHAVVASGKGDVNFFSSLLKKRQQTLRNIEKRLSEKDIATIKQESENLKQYQQTPDSEEDKKKLPALSYHDMPKTVKDYSLVYANKYEIPISKKELFTNGITYLSFVFDLGDCNPEELTMLELAVSALTEMGAGNMNYADMSSRIDRYTGGFSTKVVIEKHIKEDRIVAFADVQISALPHNFKEMVAICKDIFTRPDNLDFKHFCDLVKEKANNAYSEVVSGGTQFAMLLASAAVQPSSYANELYDGITRVQFLRKALKYKKEELEVLFGKVLALRNKVFMRKPVRLHIIGEKEHIEQLEPMLAEFSGAFRDEMIVPFTYSILTPKRRAIVINTQVNYCAQTCSGLSPMHANAGALLFSSFLLTYKWLYKKLRVEGGAYGAYCNAGFIQNLVAMGSYRDPRTIETLDDFTRCSEFLLKTAWLQSELDAMKPAVLKNFDRPQSPSSQGRTALMYDLLGYTDDIRRSIKASIYTITEDAVHAIGTWLGDMWSSAVPAIVCSKEQIKTLQKTGWLEEVVEVD
ncbi:MAG TPA: insulinase family protein, partial [Spirochaetales bacterium]|nr:insulinase family protein [Spirochaetales bacterium]